MARRDRKMPFAMWHFTIAFLALPLIAALTLGPSVDGWTPLLVVLGVLFTILSWGLAALVLRYYEKWPWHRC